MERSAQWLDVPRPKVNAEGLSLDADNETPEKLIYTMLDLIALAFQTDSTRFVTYQLASMHGAISIANKFPLFLVSRRMLMVLLTEQEKERVPKTRGNGIFTRLNALLTSLIDFLKCQKAMAQCSIIPVFSMEAVTVKLIKYQLSACFGRRKNMGYEHGSVPQVWK